MDTREKLIVGGAVVGLGLLAWLGASSSANAAAAPFDPTAGSKDRPSPPARSGGGGGGGSSPDQGVMNAQQALISMGYDVGPSGADGRMGSHTTTAIRAYQGAIGLPATGVLDATTAQKLAASRGGNASDYQPANLGSLSAPGQTPLTVVASSGCVVTLTTTTPVWATAPPSASPSAARLAADGYINLLFAGDYLPVPAGVLSPGDRVSIEYRIGNDFVVKLVSSSWMPPLIPGAWAYLHLNPDESSQCPAI